MDLGMDLDLGMAFLAGGLRRKHEYNIFYISSPTKSMSAKKIIICVILALGIGAFFAFDLGAYLSLDALKENRTALRDYVDANRATAIVLFVAVYFVQTAFSLPAGAILTLAGGFLFGSLLGTVLVNVGATAGAGVAFLMARYVLRDWVENKFANRIDALQTGFAANAFGYLLTLRLIPLFPFFLVNLVAGLTRMRLATYLAATSLGILPGSFVYAFAGRQLGGIDSLGEVASPRVLLAFTLLGLLALMPIAYQKFIAKHK